MIIGEGTRVRQVGILNQLKKACAQALGAGKRNSRFRSDLNVPFFIDKEGKVASFNMGALNKSAIGRRLEQIPQ